MIHMTMVKQKQSKKNKRILSGVFSVALGLVFIAGFVAAPLVRADRFEEQIQQLRIENDKKQGQVDALQIEASNLQETINQLQVQIDGLQSQIVTNQVKNDKLQDEIEVAQVELDKQKKLLGENIKAMYLEGQISTLEMLASSKDLSEFVDKEQYRDSVKTKIKVALDKVTDLKAQLKTQKEQVEKLLKEQQLLKNQVASQQSQQTRLLNMNQAQQAAVDAEIKDNFGKIAELKKQQAIENARRFGGGAGTVGGGGYPWGGATCAHNGSLDGPCPNYDWSVNGSIWNFATGGYGYRNCTDWAAWRVMSTGRNLPAGLGHAKTWAIRAGGSYGYPVSDNPSEGAVAINENGNYGHVMYVESVGGDGSIVVSDYNRLGDGLYRLTNLTPGQWGGLRFVQF